MQKNQMQFIVLWETRYTEWQRDRHK